MKKLLAIMLVICMALPFVLTVSAAYENEMGPAPSDPACTYEVTAPANIAPGSEIEVTVTVKNIKPENGVISVTMMFYFDKTKVTPKYISDGNNNKDFDKFIKKVPDSSWESISGMVNGENKYTLGVCTPTGEGAKADGSIVLTVPFTVNADAKGDVLFYVANTGSECLPDDGKWRSKPALGSYAVATVKDAFTLSFNTRGGNSIPSQSVAAGQKPTRPENPTREGWSFVGWYTTEKLEKSFDFTKALTADTTIYAGWSRTKYTVSFDTNGGSSVSSQSIAYESTASKPADPKKSGYKFTGWFTDKDCTAKYDFATPVVKNITLYAGWEESAEVSDPDVSSEDPVVSSEDPSDDVSDVDSSEVSEDVSSEDPDVSSDVSSEDPDVSAVGSEDVSEEISEASEDVSAEAPSDVTEPSESEAPASDAKGVRIPTPLFIVMLAVIVGETIALVVLLVIRSKDKE